MKNTLDNYTSVAKKEPNKTEITNEAYAMLEVLSELCNEINYLARSIRNG
jgi:hypothetical protein